MGSQEALRALPSVDQMLQGGALRPLAEARGHAAVAEMVRVVLAEARAAIQGGGPTPDRAALEGAVGHRLQKAQLSTLRPVFNLTGTVLHTNLGRALLAEAAVEAATAAMRDAVALEFDLETGRRGERDDHVRDLLCDLTGAEDATVVNNNAAAVLLALNSIGQGRSVLVSRGELIEIGGAFRMPDIMARAGVRLVEVGTTNRTHLKDFRAALGPDTGLILKVHPSNYRIEGFTTAVPGPALAALAREAGVPLLNDLGAGTLIDLSVFGLAREPTVRDAVHEGADLVTFSGDKLLGGPQAGFIVGRKDLIAAINANPMKRALRVDKVRLAAIGATLALYRDPSRLGERLPTLRLLSRPAAAIAEAATRLRPSVAHRLGEDYEVEVVPCASQIGSGALPQDVIPSAGLAIRPVSGHGLDDLAAALRRLERPVIGRLREGALLLDLRCLSDEPAFLASLDGLAALAGRRGLA